MNDFPTRALPISAIFFDDKLLIAIISYIKSLFLPFIYVTISSAFQTGPDPTSIYGSGNLESLSLQLANVLVLTPHASAASFNDSNSFSIIILHLRVLYSRQS